MSDPVMAKEGGFDVSERLTLEAGIIAGRLASFLATALPSIDNTVNSGLGFLQAFFESVADGQTLASFSRNPLDRTPADEPQPLDRLAQSLSFTPDEIELLLLAGLSDEHEGLAAVLRSLHPRGEPRATVGLAAQLLHSDLRRRRTFRNTLQTSAVVKSGALQLTGEGPFFERSLQPAAALWSALHGIDVWPAAVRKLDAPVATSGLEEWFETAAAKRAISAISAREPCTVMITGDSDETVFHRALALVTRAGVEPSGILMPATIDPGLDNLIGIHALARSTVPVLKFTPVDGPGAADVSLFQRFPQTVITCGRDLRDGRPLLAVPVERLGPSARQRMWRETMPRMADESSLLAARYPVEPFTATAVASDLKFISELEDREPEIADVATSISARGSVSFSAGVKLVRPRANWSDLVLSSDRLEQLREAVSRLEHQARVFDEWGFLRDRTGARGVRLLFTGPPGTGKTLSAEVLANALKVDLLVVDLSRIVSKWIGETEKNLASVFEAAERGQAALFFDEADALFGKRTEVIDAHDRYANLETAYLLTRLEQFEGLAILATNLRQNIDAAFLRRLEFVVDFEEPGREERHALWGCHLPKDAPLADDVNLYELAALYPVVGGIIRNAAVAAGFLAATDGAPIHRRHLVHAIRREYVKGGRPFPGVPIGLVVR
jgi:ATPase family associated with various cellular activities (AAA)